jgi:hypothetical protein
VGVVGVDVVGAVAFASAASDLLSLPTVIVLLELLEPQPAIRTAASVARPRPARERRGVEKTLK